MQPKSALQMAPSAQAEGLRRLAPLTSPAIFNTYPFLHVAHPTTLAGASSSFTALENKNASQHP